MRLQITSEPGSMRLTIGTSFQRTPPGARLHAARMQRHRDRRNFPAQKVTQHASTVVAFHPMDWPLEVVDARLEDGFACVTDERPLTRDERVGGSAESA